MAATYAEFRAVVFDAARGLDALNSYIETRLEIADRMEADNMPDAATEVRAVWTRAWEVLNGAPRRALLSELHEILDPVSFDEYADGSDDDGECDDDDFDERRLSRNA